METTAFIIAIFGCADGATDCRQVAMAETAYVSAAQCEAAREQALDAYTHLDFPTIAATCQKADAATLSRLNISIPAEA